MTPSLHSLAASQDGLAREMWEMLRQLEADEAAHAAECKTVKAEAQKNSPVSLGESEAHERGASVRANSNSRKHLLDELGLSHTRAPVLPSSLPSSSLPSSVPEISRVLVDASSPKATGGAAGTDIAPAPSPAPRHRKPKPEPQEDFQFDGARTTKRPRRLLPGSRDLTLKGTFRLILDQMKAEGPVIAWTVNFPRERSDACKRDSFNPTRDLYREIGRRLAASGLPTGFAFALQIGPDGLLHAHGFGCCPHEEKALAAYRKALRRAVDEWATHRSHQAVISRYKGSLTPDYGWTDYIVKETGLAISTKMYGPGPGPGRYPFPGRIWYASASYKAKAYQLVDNNRLPVDAGMPHGKSVRTDLYLTTLDETPDIVHKEPLIDADAGASSNALHDSDCGRLQPATWRTARRGPNRYAGRRRRDRPRLPSDFRHGGNDPRWRADRPRSLRPAILRYRPARPP